MAGALTATMGGGGTSACRPSDQPRPQGRTSRHPSKPEAGFEPTTCRLQGGCSGHLSYSGGRTARSRSRWECRVPVHLGHHVGPQHFTEYRVVPRANDDHLGIPPRAVGTTRPIDLPMATRTRTAPGRLRTRFRASTSGAGIPREVRNCPPQWESRRPVCRAPAGPSGPARARLTRSDRCRSG